MVTDLATDLLSPFEQPPTPAPEPDKHLCPHCGKEFPGARYWLQLGNHIKSAHPDKWGGPTKKAGPKKATAERAPRAPRQTKPAAAAPSPRAGRHNLASFFTKNLERSSKALGAVSVAGARSLQFSAPAAGPALDALIAGTRIDKPVQKIAAVGDKWEKIGAALSLPVMVTMIDLNPALGPFLEDELRDAVESILEDAIPALIKKRQRQQRIAASLRELGALDPSLASMDDPIGAIIGGFFARPEEPAGEPSA